MPTTRRFSLFSRPAASFLPDAAEDFLRARLAELWGLTLIACGLFVALALITHAGSDPSFNAAVNDKTVLNLMGRAGAHVSDILAQLFGIGGFVLALGLGTQGWAYLKHDSLKGHLAVRLLSCGVALVCVAALAAPFAAPARWGDPISLGGSTGTSVWQAANVWLPARLGAARLWVAAGVLSVFAFVSTLLAAGLPMRSWMKLGATLAAMVALIGRGAHAVWAALCGVFGREVDPLDDDEPVVSRGTRRAAVRRPPTVDESDDDETDDVDDDEEEIEKPAVKVAKKKAAPRRPKQASLGLNNPDGFELPPLELLTEEPEEDDEEDFDERTLTRNAEMLQQVLNDYNVSGEIVKISPGPVVTLYELEPAPGTKSSRVIGLCDDIARSMSALSVRAAVVPGRNVIGIEIPNKKRRTVYMHTLLQSDAYTDTKLNLPLILGKDIGGDPVLADLAKMPHLLVAGTTGSGKSVAINTMILSLVYRLPPDKCRFIMIDPKMLELSVYDDIPHLLTPVVTDPGRAVVALKWTVREMEDRYRMMSKLNVRNIDGFNTKIREARDKGEVLTRRVQTGFDVDTGKPVFEEQPIPPQELPYIVVIVDEFADLMLVAGKDVESAIQRLAQMARAAGIHLIMATQRPSVDVITGVIKANFPTRISFQVTSKIDSRTILGEGGAEQLLGRGDMLHMMSGGRIQRVHGPFVSDNEVEDVVAHLKAQGEPNYLEDVTDGEIGGDGGDMFGLDGGGSGDDMYDQAVALVAREQKASTSFIQRHLNIGYNRAAKIIEQMEKQGVVSTANHVGKREVLVGTR